MFCKMSSFRTLLGASVCLLPLLSVAALADDFDVSDAPAETAAVPPSQNWITIGGQYSSGRSDYINRFSAAQSPGFQGLGGLSYSSGDAWDSGQTFYFKAQGDNLGLDDRSMHFQLGEQGKWGVSFGYDGISYDGGHNYQSVFNPDGTLVPGNTPGGASVDYQRILPAVGSPATKYAVWQPYLTTKVNTGFYQLELQRDIFTTNGKYQYGDWLVSSGWRHEHKEGWQQQSLTIGGAPSLQAVSPTYYAPGNSSATGTQKPLTFTSGMAYFIQPIDYDMDRFDVSAAYNTRRYQAQVSYTYSQFQDNAVSIDLQNPWNFFSSASTNHATPVNNLANTFGATSNGSISGLYSLPPSNSAHQVKASFGANLAENTRLNVNLGYGVQVQNAQFVQGTGNPAVASPTLPAQNLNGLVETIFGNVALTSQPIKGLDLRLAYTIDNRDNETPRNNYLVYPISSTSGDSHQTTPFTFRHQSLVAEAGYRLWGQTKLTLNDTVDEMFRSYGLATNTETNRTTLKLRGPVMDGLFGSISGAYEDRWAHAYNPNGIWNVIDAGSTVGGASVDAQHDPTNFVMFYESSRKHAEIKTMLDASPFDNVSVSLMGKMSRDTYPSNAVGMRNNRNLSIGPDVSWEVSKAVSVHAFYTYQQLYFDQSAVYSGGSGGTAYRVPYQMNDTNSVQTAGVSADWQAIPEKLKITFDTNLSYGDTAYGLGEGVTTLGASITSPVTGAVAAFTPLPDVKSLLISVSLRGEYTINPSTSILFGYAFERFNYKDFLNNIAPTQYANAFIPGTMNPNESVHVVSAALRMKF